MRQPGKGQVAGRLELAHQVGEGHGVRPTRQRNDHARPRLREIKTADCAAQGGNQHKRKGKAGAAGKVATVRPDRPAFPADPARPA